MIKRPLGNTGIEVSELAFGGVEIGIPYGINIRSTADMLNKTESINLLHTALENGVNFFDTARMYGKSEAIIGEAFKPGRSEVIIGTKCRRLRDDDGKIPAYSKLLKNIETSLSESLRELQTDYADIYMLHQADMKILENEDVRNIFLSLKKKGAIRATGVSTYNTKETKRAVEIGMWDVIQVPFNLMDQRQQALFSLAKQKGIGIVIRSVLLKGILTPKGRNLHPALNKVEKHVKKYGELLKKTGFDLSTLAVKFALSYPEVSSVLVGIDHPAYLQKSIDAVNGKYLDEIKLSRAEELNFPDPEFLNLPYWDKMNWLT